MGLGHVLQRNTIIAFCILFCCEQLHDAAPVRERERENEPPTKKLNWSTVLWCVFCSLSRGCSRFDLYILPPYDMMRTFIISRVVESTKSVMPLTVTNSYESCLPMARTRTKFQSLFFHCFECYCQSSTAAAAKYLLGFLFVPREKYLRTLKILLDLFIGLENTFEQSVLLRSSSMGNLADHIWHEITHNRTLDYLPTFKWKTYIQSLATLMLLISSR